MNIRQQYSLYIPRQYLITIITDDMGGGCIAHIYIYIYIYIYIAYQGGMISISISVCSAAYILTYTV